MQPHQLTYSQWLDAGLSKLRMRFDGFGVLRPPRMPEGWALRAYRPGDENDWLEILRCGDFGDWNRDRLDGMLAGERGPMPRDGIFFATRADRPVGTACTFIFEDAEGVHAELGWVAVHPAHRGRGLAGEVCRAVMDYARRQNHAYVFLKTEDFRLAAIKTYLRLGFEPQVMDDTQPQRWRKLRTLVDH